MLSLSSVVSHLQSIAPLELAASWDNVGLLVEPARSQNIRRLLLTIDLTQAVLDEGLAMGAELIVAYHPPIFQPLKRLTAASPKERLLLQALAARVAIYSPHTALDAVAGGINDWLVDGLGPGTRRSLEPHRQHHPNEQYKLVVFCPQSHVEALRRALSDQAGVGIIGEYSQCAFHLPGRGTFMGSPASNPRIGHREQLEQVDEVRIEMVCSHAALPDASDVIRRLHPYETPAWDVYRLEPKPAHDVGQGREVRLDTPVKLQVLVQQIKAYLKLSAVRVATAERHRQGEKVGSVAVCPGAGGSLLTGRQADLYLTGEMRHHDVLAAVEAGTSVILTDHTHCERGYLPLLRKRLRKQLGREVEVHISRCDREPLKIS